MERGWIRTGEGTDEGANLFDYASQRLHAVSALSP